MDLFVAFWGRFAVVASSVSLLLLGVAILVWELRERRTTVERAGGPLAAVNYAGIAGFSVVGFLSAVTLAGTLTPTNEPVDTVIRLVGIAALVASGPLAVWGLRSIGRHMSSQAEVSADTQVVTTGAFALVRHPLYLSIVLLWAGGALALLSWLMALCLIILIPAFVARSRLEERLLTKHFGAAYSEYAERVPMLLPGWRPRRPNRPRAGEPETGVAHRL